MRCGRSRVVSAALLVTALSVTVATTPAVAHAQTSQADALFTQGRELLEKGNYKEACTKLQQSEELAPAIGTLLNLGYCWEQLGRMRSAMEAYSEAQILSQKSGDTKRTAFAKERFEAVSPKVMKLEVKVTDPGAAGLEIKRNETSIPKTDWGQPIPVDPDDFVVTATAPGYAPWHGTVTVRGEGSTVTVVVPPLSRSAEADGSVNLNTTRIAALGLGALAVGALSAGIATGLGAKSRYDDASSHCDPTGCDAEGSSVQQSARTQGNVGTALIGLGALAGAAGIYLWIVGGKDVPHKPTSSPPPVSASVRLELRPSSVALGGHF
ncbi:hypothetical protein AKJ09_02785 [Labilithrix luteola]|uniref:PEGA domain-containing protein n=1 Tax=Labilithrix luteola TaxID=1391654 RepID=A0A0K1PRV4_9BACT|nr:hypothetical protein [Labilithrix luteola]AKU96121.1 hypothetical protein AKJ09_02785 [Labilithrix luteola]